jgi:hypothetical protein
MDLAAREQAKCSALSILCVRGEEDDDGGATSRVCVIVT